MNTNYLVLLVAAAFTMIGFSLGRVTAPHAGGNPSFLKMHGIQKMDGFSSSDDSVEEVIQVLLRDGFQGDTIIAITGGLIELKCDGNNVDVNVQIDEESSSNSELNTMVVKMAGGHAEELKGAIFIVEDED